MLTPRPYQQEAIARGIQSNLLIADDPGLGKTLQAIEIAHAILYGFYPTSPILVICPKSVRSQWVAAITEQVPGASIVVFDNVSYPPAKPINKPIWVVMHYEAVVKNVSRLALTYWGTIIADEAHRLKNRKAKRTEAIKKLQGCRRIALTATPIDRDPGEYWSLLNWLAPQSYRSYWDWATQYQEIVPMRVAGGKVINVVKGTRNPHALAQELSPWVIQRSKRYVAPQLPPKLIDVVPIEPNPVQRNAYRKLLLAEVLPDIADDPNCDPVIKNALVRLVRLQQLLTDPKLVGIANQGAKLEWLGEWLLDNPSSPVLILTRFRETAKRISELHSIPCVIGGGA